MRRPSFPSFAGCMRIVLPLAISAAAPALAEETPVESAAPEPLVMPSSRPAKRWSTSAEVDTGSYRVSLSRGKLDMGVGFDAPTHPTQATSTTVRSTDPTRPIVPTVPSLSVGLRSDSAGAPPSSLISRAAGEGTVSAATRRVGLEWKPAQSSVFVRGGLRLTGDERVTMRVKGGRVGVYMKSTF